MNVENFQTDGYDSWKKFKTENNVLSFLTHLAKGKEPESISFMTPDGGAITLYPDRTWTYDCVPFYNGAS